MKGKGEGEGERELEEKKRVQMGGLSGVLDVDLYNATTLHTAEM